MKCSGRNWRSIDWQNRIGVSSKRLAELEAVLASMSGEAKASNLE
jgi:hypothetical protein